MEIIIIIICLWLHEQNHGIFELVLVFFSFKNNQRGREIIISSSWLQHYQLSKSKNEMFVVYQIILFIKIMSLHYIQRSGSFHGPSFVRLYNGTSLYKSYIFYWSNKLMCVKNRTLLDRGERNSCQTTQEEHFVKCVC